LSNKRDDISRRKKNNISNQERGDRTDERHRETVRKQEKKRRK
jgi:hypothetical protein